MPAGPVSSGWQSYRQVHDMQVIAVHFNGACGALEGGLLHGSYCHCNDLVLGA